MKVSKVIGHILRTAAGLFVLVGIPFLRTDYFAALIDPSADAVSSASVILDKPSGRYLVMINRAEHPDEEKLKDWNLFFSGEDVSYIFEDISCSVATADAGGMELARSFQSQLPENQMKIYPEDGTMLLSRADHGRFDIMILSEEFADSIGAETAMTDSVDVITVTQT